MEFSIKDVKNLARLAYIELSKEDEIKLTIELSKIVKWMNQLKEIDDIDNIISSINEVYANSLIERNDTITDGGFPQLIIKNSPDSNYNMFSIPKMLDY